MSLHDLPIRRRLGRSLILSFGLLVSAFFGVQLASAQENVLPLDPLTAREKATAESVAIADPRVAQLLGAARRQLVSVELLPMKPGKEEIAAAAAGRPIQMTRYAEVLFFRYEGEFGVRAVVDLNRKSVTDVTRLEGEQVPLTPNDLGDAYRLALRNADVRGALGLAAARFQVEGLQKVTGPPNEQLVVRGLPIRATDEKDPCFKHRCIQLLFRRGDVYLTEPVVTVDLTAQRVLVQRRGQ